MKSWLHYSPPSAQQYFYELIKSWCDYSNRLSEPLSVEESVCSSVETHITPKATKNIINPLDQLLPSQPL